MVSMDATVREEWFQEDHAVVDSISLKQDMVMILTFMDKVDEEDLMFFHALGTRE